MSDRPILTDAFFEGWLARRAGDHAPDPLLDAIAAAVAATPQRTRLPWQRGLKQAKSSPARRLAWRLVVAALLIAAVISTALTGAGALRWIQQHLVVPQPTESAQPTFSASPSDLLRPITLVPIGQAETIATELGAISWRRYEQPQSTQLTQITPTRFGLVALRGSDLRWSEDGVTWSGFTLSISPWRLMPLGDDLIASPLADDAIAHGASPVRLAWDGNRWAEVDRLQVDGLTDGTIASIVGGPKGIVMAATTGLFFSTDGHRFTPATRDLDASLLGPAATPLGPDDPGFGGGCTPMRMTGGVMEEPVVLATADGFVAITPRDRSDWYRSPLCEPVLWFSPDGRTWSLRSATSPFPAHAAVEVVTARNGRFLATVSVRDPSERPVWTSENGTAWTPVQGMPVAGDGLGAGEVGWLLTEPAIYLDGKLQAIPAGWLSRDGLTWTRVPGGWPGVYGGYSPPEVAVGRKVIAVGGIWKAGDTDAVQAIVIGTMLP